MREAYTPNTDPLPQDGHGKFMSCLTFLSAFARTFCPGADATSRLIKARPERRRFASTASHREIAVSAPKHRRPARLRVTVANHRLRSCQPPAPSKLQDFQSALHRARHCAIAACFRVSTSAWRDDA